MKITFTDNTIILQNSISIIEINEILIALEELKSKNYKKINIETKNVTIKDSTYIILNEKINEFSKLNKINISFNLESTNKTNPTNSKNYNKKTIITNLLISTGISFLQFKEEVNETFFFVKIFLKELKKNLTSPKNFRFKETVSQIDQSGFFAIGIVSLVTFLIGIVIAYLMGNQLRYYGANIFVVDGVAVAMCRELSPILVAIVVAGRSGSAFAAELGSMKLNHETDALEVMGLKPFQILVIPRVIGLIISLPFLVLIGDIFGILGGMFISNIHLDITYANFLERMNLALKPQQVFVGLIKAPVFALFIATIACRLGLNSEPNAVSIGNNTTKTVVHSIVSVILLNATFAIIFTQLGI
jgi:phospholipid/cholesterol/gamma-HCH transport system permease protein